MSGTKLAQNNKNMIEHVIKEKNKKKNNTPHHAHNRIGSYMVIYSTFIFIIPLHKSSDGPFRSVLAFVLLECPLVKHG